MLHIIWSRLANWPSRYLSLKVWTTTDYDDGRTIRSPCGGANDLWEISADQYLLNWYTWSFSLFPFDRNGPPKWISLHRRITPLGDEFYSLGCRSLTDFNVRYWGEASPTVPDGDPATFCVYHQTLVAPLPSGGFSSKADYTMANCSEKHQFYCQREEGMSNLVKHFIIS